MPKSHLERVLERKAAQAQEDRARWAKDHPGKPPGTTLHRDLWKSWSQQKRPNEAFREGYDHIAWD